MSSPREAVMADVARGQRGIRVRAGDVFLRGGVIVWVLDVDDGRVIWRAAGRPAETGSAAEFRSLALRRVSAPVEQAATPLDRAWQIARARTIPAEIRIRVLGRARRRRDDDAYAAQVRRWIVALAAGVDPVFEAPDA